METACFSETLVSTYEYTRRKNPEHRHPHLRDNLRLTGVYGKRLKSKKKSNGLCYLLERMKQSNIESGKPFKPIESCEN
jgi:hypothetical protein